MKKILLVLLSGLVLFTGCENKTTNENVDNTISSSLVSIFTDGVDNKKSIDEIADIISTSEIIPTELVSTKITNGDFIEGFDIEIKDFNNGYVLKPMIGSIPFIAYIFEVDNAQEFASNLEKNANLRWNICTEADEMKTSVKGNYVFFVMNPASFSE